MGVVGVAGYAEGVDDAGGEHVLLEAKGAAIAVEAGEDEPHCSEVVVRLPAESVQKLSELGLFKRLGFALVYPLEHAHHHAELDVFAATARHFPSKKKK